MMKIANAQGFWGDRVGAAARLLQQQPDLDFITMDYLAEVSLSILAIQRERHPALGYALDFVHEMASLVPYWNRGCTTKIIANAGGLNPLGCAKAVVEAVKGVEGKVLKIGVVSGDDILELIRSGEEFSNLDTGESIANVSDRLTSANVYFGAESIQEALKEGADIVITGRVADPSLVVGCALFHFEWSLQDYDKLAAATIAGHLIECGTQVTGGISTHWLDVPHPATLGFPIIEMDEKGTFVVTKAEGSGGLVSIEAVKEQLLYEIGDPENYLSPDVIVSFLGLELSEQGPNRIGVKGALGSPPPPTYKVSATYRDGYMAEGTLTLFGRDVAEKGRAAGEMILDRVKEQGFDLERSEIECIGIDGVSKGIIPTQDVRFQRECVLRVAVADHDKRAVDCFAKEIAPLVTSGPQGTTGYAQGRPRVRPVFGYWPCLVAKERVVPNVTLIEGAPL